MLSGQVEEQARYLMAHPLGFVSAGVEAGSGKTQVLSSPLHSLTAAPRANPVFPGLNWLNSFFFNSGKEDITWTLPSLSFGRVVRCCLVRARCCRAGLSSPHRSRVTETRCPSWEFFICFGYSSLIGDTVFTRFLPFHKFIFSPCRLLPLLRRSFSVWCHLTSLFLPFLPVLFNQTKRVCGSSYKNGLLWQRPSIVNIYFFIFS